MIYRRFGKTGLSMPVLSFGSMRSMHGWHDKPLSVIPDHAQDDLRAILRQALSHGINHIETASGYGSSERQLGALLQDFPRNDFILQTKVTPSEDPDVFLAKVTQSMERLQVDRLDLLALHGINDHRSLWQSCRKNGCLAAARTLQNRGIIDHIGFSGHGPCDVIMQALNHEEDGGFDFVNLHWYYIFDANRRAIELAAHRDIGLFIISPSDKGGHLHTPSPALVQLCAPLSPMLFNDIYCLQQNGVCTISVGASAPDHFDEHLKVLSYLDPVDATSVEIIDARLRLAMQQTTGFKRPDALWDQLPPWDQAPGNINLRIVLWLFNLYRAWDMVSYSRERYTKLGTGSAWVPGNNGSGANTIDVSSLSALTDISPDELKQLLLQAHEALKN